MFVRYKGLDYEIIYLNTYGDSGEYMELWCKWLNVGGGARRHPLSGLSVGAAPLGRP